MNIRKLTRFLFISFVAISYSCNLRDSKPQEIFAVIGLNANKISRSFERDFTEIRQHKENGNIMIPAADKKTMRPASCVEYIKYSFGITFKDDIEKIKKLKVNDETKPIINAGLDMFQYADDIYQKDYPVIAKMIDDGKSDSEIDAAAAQLQLTKGVELEKKYNTTMELLLPYAQKHGVKYKTID